MKKLLFCVCFLLSCSAAVAMGNVEEGKRKSETCVACHGMDGNSMNGEWPNLAGQHAKYLNNQLILFKKGKDGGRYNALMAGMVAALTPEDMQDLAAYFSQQQVKVGAVDKQYLKRGQALYRGGNSDKGISACIACHGPRGLGNAQANFPSLSGQHPQYVMNQLKAYRSGERSTGANSTIMQMVAKRMDDNDIEAVAHYVSGLH